MRALVTIRTISEIRPIEGADKIELAIIDGWQCVVKKEEFKVGDKGLYFEIDSFLPISDERFRFLEKNAVTWKNHYGARIKTIKLRGQLSQGLILPLSSFPEIKTNTWGMEKDYSLQLGVLKWEREDTDGKQKEKKTTWLGRKLKKLKYTKLKPIYFWLEKTFPTLFSVNATRPFPNFIPKTDEERIQNLINKLDLNSHDRYEWSIKLDGSSMTVYYNRGKVGVCSRNLDLVKDSENKYWSTAIDYNYPKALKKLKKNIAIQGELMGPGIQGNREKLLDYRFFIYKVWDIDSQKYLSLQEVDSLIEELVGKQVPADRVPSLGLRPLSSFKTIEDFLTFAEGPSLNAQTREGVVATKLDGTKGFKVISNSYLLEKGE